TDDGYIALDASRLSLARCACPPAQAIAAPAFAAQRAYPAGGDLCVGHRLRHGAGPEIPGAAMMRNGGVSLRQNRDRRRDRTNVTVPALRTFIACGSSPDSSAAWFFSSRRRHTRCGREGIAPPATSNRT